MGLQTLDAYSIGLPLVAGVFLPLIVAYVTNSTWASPLKGLFLAALAGATGIFAQAVAALDIGQDFDWTKAVVAAVGTWFVAGRSYTDLWKRATVTKKLQSKGEPDRVLDTDDPDGEDLTTEVEAFHEQIELPTEAVVRLGGEGRPSPYSPKHRAD